MIITSVKKNETVKFVPKTLSKFHKLFKMMDMKQY